MSKYNELIVNAHKESNKDLVRGLLGFFLIPTLMVAMIMIFSSKFSGNPGTKELIFCFISIIAVVCIHVKLFVPYTEYKEKNFYEKQIKENEGVLAFNIYLTLKDPVYFNELLANENKQNCLSEVSYYLCFTLTSCHKGYKHSFELTKEEYDNLMKINFSKVMFISSKYLTRESDYFGLLDF